MGYTKGLELMEDVIKKLSKGRTIYFQLSEAFTVVGTGCPEDFSVNEYNELQLLNNEYNNQIMYETSTVDNCGELNSPYESLFHLSDRLKSLAERIIETNKKSGD